MTERIDGRRTRYLHRRGEILSAVTEHALEHGVAALTLRGAAAAVGVSHATLVHHFATRDDLITEIVDQVLTRALLSPPELIDSGYDAQAGWAYLKSREGLRYARLYISLVGLALYDEPPFADALRRSLDVRRDALAEGMRRLGCPDEEAQPLATALLAQLRGLVTDLLLTGDTARVDAAFAALTADQADYKLRWAAAPGGTDAALRRARDSNP
jgi:AcrR family transcriptional regulator